MRGSVRSVVTTSIAIAAASTLAFTFMSLPTEPHSPPTVRSEINFSAAAVEPTTPPPGVLIEQFLANQIENCSLICPFIVQGLVQVPLNFAALPLTLVRLLLSGQPFLQAAALSGATVSGALNDAVTGIITNDLNQVLPRAQNALEVAVVGLIEIGTTAVLQPGNLLHTITAARAGLFDALRQPPGTMPPPPVHNALEAAAVRVIEIASALTFQAPERLLLGATQAPNAFFTTLGNTGDLGATLAAVAASVSTTISDSIGFIQHALSEPIPITLATLPAPQRKTNQVTAAMTATPQANTTVATTTTPVAIRARTQTRTTPSLAVPRPTVRPSATADANANSAQAPSLAVPPGTGANTNAYSAQSPSVVVPRPVIRPSARVGGNTITSTTSGTDPVGSLRKPNQTVSRAVTAPGNNKHPVPKKPSSQFTP